MATRGKKGAIGIESVSGMLRLRLPRHLFGGTQKYISLGLPDTEVNRQAAQAKARVIESDIAFEKFDSTLDRYRPKVSPSEPPIDLANLWARYTHEKTKTLSTTTIRKDYRKVANHIDSLPHPMRAKQIRRYFIDRLTPSAAKKLMMFINACCEWAVGEELIESNPFARLPAIRAKKQGNKINPFSAKEKQMIIRAFEEDERWCCYAPFVKFLFFTGCRPSEAIALQWLHISPDLSVITFSEALVLGNRKDTKTHTTRKFPCNESIRSLLSSVRPPNPIPEQAIFKSPTGFQIDDHNFQQRAWREVVSKLPIEYRPSYNCRHTFITLCLEEGVPVTQVAAWVGNSPKTIWQHYAGLVSSHDVPDFSE